MQRETRSVLPAAAAVLVLGGLLATPLAAVAAGGASAAAEGKELAFDRRKGNCLACHMMAGGESPGNIGPPLVAMKARYPEKTKLRSQIWDASKANPDTSMPPFGKHQVLSEEEIDKIVEFVWGL